jgi:hypothetical protein
VTNTWYAVILGILTGLFTLRVVGQALVAFVDAPFLPPMEQWYSGLMPYPILLPTQLVMIVGMVVIVRDVARSSGTFATPRRRVGLLLVWSSYLYALSMAIRYVATMILHPERRWVGHTIPIWFHLVLAAFVYTLGRYHVDDAGITADSDPRA